MASASNLKLIYFDVRGLGEISRLILAYADKPYEDKRVAPADWPSLKESTKPFNAMPLLEMDGQVYPQSGAISTYLAREFGLYPSDHKEQLIVDIVLATLSDMVKLQAKWFYLPDSPEKQKMKEDCPNQTEKFMAYLENLLAQNGTGYFVGNSLTMADLAMFDAMTGYVRNSIGFSEEKFPHLAKNKELVLKNDNISNYVAKRPDSRM